MKKIIVLLAILFVGGIAVSLWFNHKNHMLPIEENIYNNKNEYTRPPAVAGAFYPADSDELEKMVEGFLSNASSSDIRKERGHMVGLLVPHAGYQFSGQVAAFGYKNLVGEKIDTVIIIGNSHHYFFDGVAVFDSGYFETPLGKVPIDEKLAKEIVSESNKIFSNREYHLNEHSIEVQLPFLQKTLKHFKIVPVLFGNKNKEDYKILSEAILKHFYEKSLLIVASSDLSHYPRYEDAIRVDRITLDSIISGKVSEFEKTLAQLSREHVPGAVTFACGDDAVKTLLEVMSKIGVTQRILLKYANSGDVPEGDRERVVGYGAVGFFWNKKPNLDFSLNENQKKTLLEIAKKSVEEFVKNGSLPSFNISDPILSKHLGAFVTLKKNGKLRGCIGIFSPSPYPLWETVSKMAIAAATEDIRFSPVTPEELPDIEYEISVLTPAQLVSDWRDIKLGLDGVIVERGNSRGVFLPQVATETGWSLEEFLTQLCVQKAGLEPDCYKNPQTKVFVFRALVFSDQD